VGTEVTGEVEEVHYIHGVFVDFGAKLQGLIPVDSDTWTALNAKDPQVYASILPGKPIRAKIAALLDPKRFRFPVVLEVLEPAGLRPYVFRQRYPPVQVLPTDELDELSE
jgi:hypothetical protein